ncbi:MAG: hypothetical protein K9G24_02565 [Candidatus Nanopelagicales bacterium]|nr:hypothetical protein [Candidatus Nanopelagicales bacterium]MCF8541946.1 hypothetical protein [Candidatus Nanopelagicales bacterium]MCF8556573.1 hypothetical protein [Candidatus Nanopelagicales bacterium]
MTKRHLMDAYPHTCQANELSVARHESGLDVQARSGQPSVHGGVGRLGVSCRGHGCAVLGALLRLTGAPALIRLEVDGPQ